MYVHIHLSFFSDFAVSRFYCDTRFWRSICHNPSAFASFCHLSPSWGSLYCVVSKVGSRRASKVQGKWKQVFYKLDQCTTYFDLTAKKDLKVRQQLYFFVCFLAFFVGGIGYRTLYWVCFRAKLTLTAMLVSRQFFGRFCSELNLKHE